MIILFPIEMVPKWASTIFGKPIRHPKGGILQASQGEKVEEEERQKRQLEEAESDGKLGLTGSGCSRLTKSENKKMLIELVLIFLVWLSATYKHTHIFIYIYIYIYIYLYVYIYIHYTPLIKGSCQRKLGMSKLPSYGWLLLWWRVVDHVTIHNVSIHHKRIRSNEIDLDEGWWVM